MAPVRCASTGKREELTRYLHTGTGSAVAICGLIQCLQILDLQPGICHVVRQAKCLLEANGAMSFKTSRHNELQGLSVVGSGSDAKTPTGFVVNSCQQISKARRHAQRRAGRIEEEMLRAPAHARRHSHQHSACIDRFDEDPSNESQVLRIHRTGAPGSSLVCQYARSKHEQGPDPAVVLTTHETHDVAKPTLRLLWRLAISTARGASSLLLVSATAHESAIQ